MRIYSLIALLFMHVALHAETKVISLVALENDPPFAYKEKEESKGLLIEILNKVATQLPQYDIKLSHSSWQNIQDRKFSGPVDGFLGAYFRIARWDDAYPYSYPIYHEQMCIVCAGTKPLGEKHKDMQTVVWPRDYVDTRLGTVRYYSGWLNYGEQARTLGSVNVFEFPDPKIALKGTHAGTVDCTLFEKTVFRALIKSMVASGELPENHTLRIATDLERDSVHIAYFEKQMTTEKLQFVRDFDTAFAVLLKSNQLYPIYQKYGVTH